MRLLNCGKQIDDENAILDALQEQNELLLKISNLIARSSEIEKCVLKLKKQPPG
jgi:hypothetical protein